MSESELWGKAVCLSLIHMQRESRRRDRQKRLRLLIITCMLLTTIVYLVVMR